jgi:hypothetical protein
MVLWRYIVCLRVTSYKQPGSSPRIYLRYVMVCGRLPYDHDNMAVLFHRIAHAVSSPFAANVRMVLIYDRANRITKFLKTSTCLPR